MSTLVLTGDASGFCIQGKHNSNTTTFAVDDKGGVKGKTGTAATCVANVATP